MQTILESLYTQDTLSNNNFDTDTSRTQFQREHDQVIFSSAFRRLQNKTQVFPLSVNRFVHNRLTHSLEVASVGRSLGYIFATIVKKQNIDIKTINWYELNLANIIATACLCHDIGNPPFGHAGEEAISRFFTKYFQGNSSIIVDEQQKQDLCNFEGNANSFRIICQAANSDIQLSLTTIASFLKYPCSSIASLNSQTKTIHNKKYNFFQNEAEHFNKINTQFNLHNKRHPFCFLVEAADDICYSVIDIEDAHRLNIISFEQANDILMSGFCNADKDNITRRIKDLDVNEKISYIRSKLINRFIKIAENSIETNFEKLINKSYYEELIVKTEDFSIDDLKDFAQKHIYKHHRIIEVNIAGFQAIDYLLECFVEAIRSKDKYDELLLGLLPYTYLQKINMVENYYQKFLIITDYISGMTDHYATSTYRKLKGIHIDSSF